MAHETDLSFKIDFQQYGDKAVEGGFRLRLEGLESLARVKLF